MTTSEGDTADSRAQDKHPMGLLYIPASWRLAFPPCVGLNITLNPFRDCETTLISGTAPSKNIQGELALEGDCVPAIQVEGINIKDEQKRKYLENVGTSTPSLHP